jgi:hypothetical protein
MSTLRRILPAFAALLAVLVVVQTTDLLACADEAVAAEYTGGTHTDALAAGGHPVPAPGDSHDDEEHGHDESTFADCLCHVVFTPTGVVPDAGVRPSSEPAEFAAFVAAPPEVEPLGLDHVPLA